MDNSLPVEKIFLPDEIMWKNGKYLCITQYSTFDKCHVVDTSTLLQLFMKPKLNFMIILAVSKSRVNV